MGNVILRTVALSKTYRSGEVCLQALCSVELELLAGTFTALVGPSGSGKSTLLNICGLIDSADSGDLSFDGDDINACSDDQCTLIRRYKLGFVFQGFNLSPVMSVFDNVEYPLFLANVARAERRRQVNEILERVDLIAQAEKLPDQISGGQKQRVAIARALVKRPKLVIADEPTANLDTETATAVIDLMHDMSRDSGSSFLIATHDDRMSSRCDYIHHLQDGHLQDDDLNNEGIES